MILLDTGSTITTIMNPDLITNICTAKYLIGMRTNAGSKKLMLKGDINKYGSVWYDPTSAVNIFGFSELIDKGYKIKYDSDIADTFMIKDKNNNTIQFGRTEEGLYTYKPSNKYMNKVAMQKNMIPMSNIVTTIKENRSGYI